MVQRPIAVGLLADLTQRVQLPVDSQRLTVERDTLILCPMVAEGQSVSSAGLIGDLLQSRHAPPALYVDDKWLHLDGSLYTPLVVVKMVVHRETVYLSEVDGTIRPGFDT
jgi:hypothetical protein